MERTKDPPLLRTCPSCNSQIDPTHMFCEICGAKMPELPVCRNCGARFIAPVKFCELCGTPVSPQEVPRAVPEVVPEAVTGPGSGAGRKPVPPAGPAGKIPAAPIRIPAGAVTPGPAAASGPNVGQVPLPPERTTGKKAVPEAGTEPGTTVGPEPAPQAQEPLITEDDVLFFTRGDTVPDRPAGSRTRWIAVGIVLLVIMGAAALFALPFFTGTSGPGTADTPVTAAITPLPDITTVVTTQPTPAETPLPTPAYGPLIPQPTQVLPAGQKVYFQVQKDPVSAKISVIYAGSSIANSVTSADITVTQPGGAIATGIILPAKGVTELPLDGSKGADRVVILVHLTNGQTYRVYDQLLPLRS